MKKIRDLIDVPAVDTVIQVSSIERYDESEVKSRIFESFVVTDDIRKGLLPILADTVKDTGAGFMLKGGYGSGKSHFIAYLCAIFNYPDMMKITIRHIPELKNYENEIIQKKLLPLSLSLTDYSSVNSLSDIIVEKISRSLIERSIKLDLPDLSRQIAEFKERVLPAFKNEFSDHISESDFDKEPPGRQRDIINSFLSMQKSSLRLFYDYNELFSSLDMLLKESYPGGLFLLFDELSEFLRARGRGELVSEDIRFIQFMGEKTRSSNLRVLFSMQENIEEVASISADGLNRIKDRYPVRINLSTLHLRELVEKRLLVKKEGSSEEINGVYRNLADAFPRWRHGADDFYLMYPVHPETFRMLEGVAGLFSKTRGLVDFIVTEVGGNISRGIPGILDEDCTTLLFPDRIFDHFRNNLEESIEYNWLMTIVFNSIERDVPSIFKDAKDSLLASRIFKLIMLYQILPGANPPSAQDLANLVMDKRSKLDPDLNYTFIREKILRRLERETSFLSSVRGDTDLEDTFFFQREENPIALFEKKIQQFLQKNPGREKQSLWYFISRMRDERLPLADLRGGGRSFKFIFENTIRESLAVQMGLKSIDSEELDIIRRKLSAEETDAVIIIGYPVDDPDEASLYVSMIQGAATKAEEALVFIKPRSPRAAELELLLKGYAMSSVFEESSATVSQGSAAVDILVKEAVERAERVILDLYTDSRIFHFSDKEIEESDIVLTGSFEKTVEIITKPVLKRIFPWHSKIAPGVDITSRETFNQIIKLFAVKDIIDFNFEGSKALKNTIDALFPYKGIILKTSNQYQIAPDPSVNSFIREIISYVRENGGSFEKIYNYFRKGPWGIKRDLFSLYLFILHQTGFVTLERGGRALKGQSLDLRALQMCDSIRTGDELSPLFLERFELLGPFAEGLTAKKIHLQIQNKVWDDLVSFKREKEQDAARILAELKNLKGYPVFRNHPLDKIEKSVEIINQFIGHIFVSKNSRDGLQYLLEFLVDFPDMSFYFELYERYMSFRNLNLDRIIFIYDYLSSSAVMPFEGLKDKYLNLLDDMKNIEEHIIKNNIEEFISRFAAFQEEYADRYADEHKKIQSASNFFELEAIKQTVPYRVLYNLSRIEIISVESDLIRVDEIINSAAASVCRRQVLQELKRRPFCECRLSQPSSKYNAEYLSAMIRDGIRQYFALLQNEENRRKIISYTGSMSGDQEQEERAILKGILSIDPDRTDDATLLRASGREAVALINSALSGTLRVVKKDLEDFTGAVYGRRYRKHELMKIFEKWLLADMPGGSDEDIIFELSNPSAEETILEIPPVLADDLKPCVRTNRGELRVRALVLFYLLRNIEGINAADIISKSLFVDFDEQGLTLLVDRYTGFIEGVKNWEVIFEPGFLNEVLKGADIDSLGTDSLLLLFSRSGGLSTVMTLIIETFIMDERILLPETIYPFSGGEAHIELLNRYRIFLECKKKYHRESGKKSGFPAAYFIAAARALIAGEKLKSIAFHNNILAELVSGECDSLRESVMTEAEGHFKEILPLYEKSMSPGTIIPKIETLSPLLIVFDSLRIDLFLEMVSFLSSEGITCSAPELYCVPLPSDTLTYRSELFPGIIPENGLVFEFNSREWIFIKAAERDYRKNDVRSIISNNSESGVILWIGILDEKIHSTKQDLATLSREMEIFCREIFIPLLREVPIQRTICITADHGFVENTSYSAKNEPRYSHGGNSFPERLVPFVKCRRK